MTNPIAPLLAAALLCAACGGPAAQTLTPDPADQSDALDASASATTTGCAVPGSLVTYLHKVTSDLSDTRCGPASGGTCTIDLQGYLFVPSGAGPHPAIVWNHGSEEKPGPKCSIADYFVPQGYAVFVPHRRGHGRSTGLYLTDPAAPQGIQYLEMQVADVQAAWSYLKGLTDPAGGAMVDPQRMAIAGHSYGGIMTLLTNATRLGQKAALDLCGDSESWANTSFQGPLYAAVDAARAPIFFAQPANDVHTEPTIEYSHRAALDGQLYQATIYPPVPDVSSAQEAHSRFVGDPAQVAIWGPGALDFLHRFGM